MIVQPLISKKDNIFLSVDITWGVWDIIRMNVELHITEPVKIPTRSEILPITLKPSEKARFATFSESYNRSASSMARDILLTAMDKNPAGPHG